MVEYFYTVDLGEIHGPKLEAMAAQAFYDDVEAFAAMLLCGAIDLIEADDQAKEAASGAGEHGEDDPLVSDPEDYLDEDIPF